MRCSCPSVKMPQCTQISHWAENTFSLLPLLIPPLSIRNIWCFLSSLPPSSAHHLRCCRRHHIQYHTHSPFFSRLVYKLEQLRFTATSFRSALPQKVRAQVGYLWMGLYYELETRAGRVQIFWLSVSTHHIGKQLYYKLVCFQWHWWMCSLDYVEV